MKPRWEEIDGFPDYYVNNLGEIVNVRRDTPMTYSYNQNGNPTVGLVADGKQYKRSVSTLVAKAFLPPPEREDFNTVIHLDGNRSNCKVHNLMWRPRWFAVNFHIERANPPYPEWNVPILIEDTGEVFANPSEIAMRYGVLEKDIHASCFNSTSTFPYGHTFSFVRD